MTRARLDRWLFETFVADAASLAVVRVLTGVVLLVSVFPRWLWVSALPEAAYHPPVGLALLVASPPPSVFYVTLNVVGMTGAVLLMLGMWTTAASLVVSAVLLLGNTFAYAFGKIDHDILLVLLPLAGAAAGWGHALGWRADATTGTTTGGRRWPLALFALLIALVMARSGHDKAFTGWLDPSRAAVRTHLLRDLPTGRTTGTARLALDTWPPAIWEAADIAAVSLEVSFLVAVWWRRSWLTVLAAACVFHFANSLLFGIQFLWNPVAYGLFVPWATIAPTRGLVGHWPRVRRALPIVAVVALLLGMWRVGFGLVAVPATAAQAWLSDVVLLAAAAVLGAASLLHVTARAVRALRP